MIFVTLCLRLFGALVYTRKVVSDILGHERVNLAMDTYDRTEVEDFVQPLTLIASQLVVNELVANGSKSASAT